MKPVSIRLLLILAILLLRGTAPLQAQAPEEPASPPRQAGVHLTPAQMQAGGITLQVAQKGLVRDSIQLLGEIKVDQTRLVRVVPRVSGIATRIPRQVGDRVEAGEVLAVLESPELGQAKIELVSAALTFRLAQHELEHHRTIYTNTKKMLEVLEPRPSLQVVREKLAGLYIGADKGKVLEPYSQLTFAQARLDRERDLMRQQISSEQVFQEAERDFQVAAARFEAAEESVRHDHELEILDTEKAFEVADNALHNARRRLLILGSTESEIAQLTWDRGESRKPVENHSLEAHEGFDELDRKIAEFTLRSPIAGQVLERKLSLGERVTPDHTPFLVGDLGQVWVDLAIYPRDLSRVRAGLGVEIRAEGVDVVARGLIAFVQPILSEQVRAAHCRVVLPNPEGHWKPGLFVSGKVLLPTHTARVRVPRSAVIRRGDDAIGFVQDGDALVPRVLELGSSDGETLEVLSGISPGETYAATGAFVLKTEFLREELGEDGHSH